MVQKINNTCGNRLKRHRTCSVHSVRVRAFHETRGIINVNTTSGDVGVDLITRTAVVAAVAEDAAVDTVVDTTVCLSLQRSSIVRLGRRDIELRVRSLGEHVKQHAGRARHGQVCRNGVAIDSELLILFLSLLLLIDVETELHIDSREIACAECRE
jgi:hypothetical protein